MGNDWDWRVPFVKPTRTNKLNSDLELLGEINYTDQYGRNWKVIKKAAMWKTKPADKMTWLVDNNFYQLMQQIDKQPPPQ
jgi:hypothetical protein